MSSSNYPKRWVPPQGGTPGYWEVTPPPPSPTSNTNMIPLSNGPVFTGAGSLPGASTSALNGTAIIPAAAATVAATAAGGAQQPYAVSALSTSDGSVKMKLRKTTRATASKKQPNPPSPTGSGSSSVKPKRGRPGSKAKKADPAAPPGGGSNNVIDDIIASVANGTASSSSSSQAAAATSRTMPPPSATVTSASITSVATTGNTLNYGSASYSTATAPLGPPPPIASTSSIWTPAPATQTSYWPTTSSSTANQSAGWTSSGNPVTTSTSVSSAYNNNNSSWPSLGLGNFFSSISSSLSSSVFGPTPPPPPPTSNFVPPRPPPPVVTTKARAARKPTAAALRKAAAAAAAATAAASLTNPAMPPLTVSGPIPKGKKIVYPAAQSTNPLLLPTSPPPPVTPTALSPPQWQECYDDTSVSLSTYKSFPIDSKSLEYQTITEMLSPTKVLKVEKIVNPDLWQRYINTRKEMLRSKSDNLDVLSKLGLDEREVMRCAHLSLNFDKDPLLLTESGAYSPNEVLLFHCTRSKENLSKILNQGLDERLSSTTGGLLGKGIYFADDPQKSIQYDCHGTGIILIFSVLLGDCLGVDHVANKHLFVREPEKENTQKRNFNDQFFDSITARPGGSNEYVIYNRYQCCPLYQVKYQQRGGANGTATNYAYSSARMNTPTVAWRTIAGGKCPMPNQLVDGSWPFYAAHLFEKMGVLPPAPEPVNNGPNALNNDDDQFEPYIPDNFNNASRGANANNVSDADTKENLESLVNLGFFDEAKNKEVLQKYNNNLSLAANFLLDDGSQGSPPVIVLPQPSTSSASASATSTSTTSKNSKTQRSASITTVELSSDSDDDDDSKNPDIKKAKLITEDLPPELANWALDFDDNLLKSQPSPAPPLALKEDCPICCNEYDNRPSLWKELRCSHKLCLSCYNSIETKGTTMSGLHCVSIKCPFCQGITGIEVGTCPDGNMTELKSKRDCDGYKGHGSIQIDYVINSGKHHLHRTAYLPNSPEGNEVLKLLKTAWDRRLVFTIGTSVTTGVQNTLVWNIHHKTDLQGGVQSHGYPDPTYLERVKWELKAYGIE